MPKNTTSFTPEIGERICELLMEGMTLREACRQDGMPAESTVRRWAAEDVEGFFAQYTRAREIGYMAMADEVVEISDNGTNDWMERNGKDDEGWEANGEHLQRSRLRVDTRKWLLSKALPKMYGDKLAIGGDKSMDPIQTEDVSPVDQLAQFINAKSRRQSRGDDGSGEA